MSDAPATHHSEERFVWHPEYAGKSVDSVQRDLRDEIARDQRQFQLSLEGAETSEHDSLTSIVELERRWGQFDFDWAETDPDVVASKIIAFEQEREQRQEMISFATWRDEQADTGEETTPEFAWKTAPVLIGGALMIIIIVVILALAL